MIEHHLRKYKKPSQEGLNTLLGRIETLFGNIENPVSEELNNSL